MVLIKVTRVNIRLWFKNILYCKMRHSIIIALLIFPLFLFAQEIKVMSFNIRLDVKSDGENQWNNRKEKVASLMNYYEADFIGGQEVQDRKSTRLNSSHSQISYAVFCLKKKK